MIPNKKWYWNVCAQHPFSIFPPFQLFPTFGTSHLCLVVNVLISARKQREPMNEAKTKLSNHFARKTPAKRTAQLIIINSCLCRRIWQECNQKYKQTNLGAVFFCSCFFFQKIPVTFFVPSWLNYLPLVTGIWFSAWKTCWGFSNLKQCQWLP